MLCKVILLLGLMAPIGWAASGPEVWSARIKAGEQGDLTAQLSIGYAYAQGEVVTKICRRRSSGTAPQRSKATCRLVLT